MKSRKVCDGNLLSGAFEEFCAYIFVLYIYCIKQIHTAIHPLEGTLEG